MRGKCESFLFNSNSVWQYYDITVKDNIKCYDNRYQRNFLILNEISIIVYIIKIVKVCELKNTKNFSEIQPISVLLQPIY